MSQYPYNNPWGYGHQYPAPVPPPHPPPPPQFGYPNPAPYSAPPGYGQPYEYNVPPPPTEAHHSASQQSFNYNAANIPGLGAGGTAPAAPPFNNSGFAPNTWAQQPQPSTFPPFNQHPPPFPAHVAPPPYSSQPAQFAPATAPPNSQQNPSQHPPAANPAPQSGPQPAQPIASIEMEEGELSEGQFEDLYGESRESSQPAVTGANVRPPASTHASVAKVIASTTTSRPTSAADTPEGGFYENEEDEGEVASFGHGNDRERSKSYSPFLSPVEADQGATQEAAASKQNAIGPQTQSRLTQGEPAREIVPGLHISAQKHTNASKADDSSQFGAPATQGPIDYMSSFKSVREAKKEAQKAILRLWPLGVKYQNYIEEGFDQKVVKALFGDLNLDMPKTPTDSPSSQPKDSHSPGSGQPVEAQQKPAAAASPDSSAMPGKSKGEERKDRIARLLALKAAKGPVVAATKPAATQPKADSQPPEPATQAQNAAPAPPTGPKTKQWGEKERILQEKIAALQAKAQKAASGKATANTGQSNMPGVPAQAHQPQPSPFIPGLSLSPAPQPSTTNQRKRPVASDFVDYQSSPGPLKRPYGQIRQDTSLIIDVSDASDDEEMDMDLGSPDEDASFFSSRAPQLSRGPSIRDFPPLTDNVLPRSFSTPLPSQTPPAGPGSGKKRDNELTLKEKEIQEMRRKIALAEAKRKAKQSSVGSQTPVQADRTPELKNTELTRLPRREREAESSSTNSDSASLNFPKSRLDPLQRAERRGRIVSLDLPRVDTSLEEKLSRLEQLRNEEARLRAEIDKELSEKRLLTKELEQLETPSTETSNTNGVAGLPEPEGLSAQTVDVPADVDMTLEGETPASSTSSQDRGDVSMEADADTLKQLQDQQSTPSNTLESSQAAFAQAESEVKSGHSVEGPPEKDAPAQFLDSISSESRTADACPPKASPEQQRLDGNIAETTQTVHEESSMPEQNQPEGHDNGLATNLEVKDQQETSKIDETVPMDLESRSPSPAVPTPMMAIDGDTPDIRQSSVPILELISDAARPREDVQEIEAETTGEAKFDKSSTLAESTLAPYESPLRYFHAYRFHPDYQKSVSGGLKSLTYTNRIDPTKPLCPYELRNEQCPADCEFQHLKSVEVAENQILLELGNADHVPPDQKNRFIAGLRELLKGFKTNKVKDFNVIARGIIQYRSQFLGDQSKVLNLDGVSI